jgi:hypothetical protein
MKILPAYYGNGRFIVAFTEPAIVSVPSQANPIHIFGMEARSHSRGKRLLALSCPSVRLSSHPFVRIYRGGFLCAYFRVKFETGLKKVKFTLQQPVKAWREGGSKGVAVQFFKLGARWGEWSVPRPGRFAPEKGTRYPSYRRLVGPQGRSGWERKISPPPDFEALTAQHVVCRSNDYAIPVVLDTGDFYENLSRRSRFS